MSLPREQRVAAIRAALESALLPQQLDVVDDSHKHAGHEGARDGRGHYNVTVVAEAFAGKLPLARHRLVYAALGDLMQTDIHALAIRALAPGEEFNELRDFADEADALRHRKGGGASANAYAGAISSSVEK